MSGMSGEISAMIIALGAGMLLFAMMILPTAVIWYRDRSYPPGTCLQFRYDLTGNKSVRCPECGNPTAMP